MKIKSLSLFVLMLLAGFGSIGQTTNDSILLREFEGKKVMVWHGQPIDMQQCATLMRTNTDAYNQLKKARFDNGLAASLIFAGSLGVALPLAQAIMGTDHPQWWAAGAGAACLGLAFPVKKAYITNRNRAIDLYNSKQSLKSSAGQLMLGLSQNGFGLQLRF